MKASACVMFVAALGILVNRSKMLLFWVKHYLMTHCHHEPLILSLAPAMTIYTASAMTSCYTYLTSTDDIKCMETFLFFIALPMKATACVMFVAALSILVNRSFMFRD